MSADVEPSLPAGVRRRSVASLDNLTISILEAGFEEKGRPLILLLHGFPDIAYTWRRTLGPLAAARYHVVAPDLRGFGNTTGWDDTDLVSFSTHSLARDLLGLVSSLGHRCAAAVVGHDVGSMIAAYCALVRPDVFRSLVMMSFPFDGPPNLPFASAASATAPAYPTLAEQLSALPRPRIDSMSWFSKPSANADMRYAPQGVHDFLRAYFHVKSADWSGNRPHALTSGSAEELSELPTYYIMDKNVGMAATVAPFMPSPDKIASNRWLSESELAVYTTAFERSGFQGGLNWFRCHTGSIGRAEIELFSGRTIDVPAAFISGALDWGNYRKPGAIERMQTRTCKHMTDVHLIEDAGHWIQVEQHERFNAALLNFLKRTTTAD